MIELFRHIMGLPPGASTVADGVDALHAAVAASTLLVGMILFIVAATFVVRYRRKSPRQTTPHIESSRLTETAIVSFVTASFIAFWVIGFGQYADITTAPSDAETVYVDAKQWTWKFAYADGRAENDVLTVPAGKPIKLIMTSRDVIHSFFVPAFRVKQDVLPGRYTTTWFNAKTPGTYPIWCAEYCGVSHSAMLGSVHVLSQADYDAWETRAPNGGIAERGREVAANRGCVACHSLDGRPGVGPTFKGLYGSVRPLADGRHVIADDAYLTRAIVDPNADVVAGYPAGMPPYQGILEPSEVAALVELVRGDR